MNVHTLSHTARGAPLRPTTGSRDSIFRPEAVRRYIAGNEAAVLPALVAPPVIVALWLLLGVVGLAVGLAWATPVPVYASGRAVVVSLRSAPSSVAGRGAMTLAGEGEPILVAVFPPETRTRLAPGQMLVVRNGTEIVRAPIVAVEAAVVAPRALETQFGVAPERVGAQGGPTAVVTAEWQPGGGAAAKAYVGSEYGVQVQIGTRRMLAIVPGLDRLWEAR